MAALDYATLAGRLGRSRLLFIAHREEILDQSLATFRYALRDASFGEKWVGGARPTRFDHVFASIQSLHAGDLDALPPDHFDVVIVDEFHHAAATSYRRILDHLQPVELLGLTATPERSDGLPILQWFDDRIAAELRLWEAIDQQHLSPFLYFGIHDGLDLRDIPWRRGRGDDVDALSNAYTSSDAWARLVVKEVADHADPSSMRALGFCVSCTVLDFVGTHRKEFRFDRRYQALLGGSRRDVEREVHLQFPFLPAGCHMHLDAKASEVVLRSLRDAIPTRWPAKVNELRSLRRERPDLGLAEFLIESGLDLDDVYDGNKSWSDLREAAGADVLAPGPDEAVMRRAIGRLLHIDDRERIDTYRRHLASPIAPEMSRLPERERRLVHMLLAAVADRLLGRDTSVQQAAELLWGHPQVRSELSELFGLLDGRIDHLHTPLATHPDSPLQIHARYTRIEILAAFGLGSGAATWASGRWPSPGSWSSRSPAIRTKRSPQRWRESTRRLSLTRRCASSRPFLDGCASCRWCGDGSRVAPGGPQRLPPYSSRSRSMCRPTCWLIPSGQADDAEATQRVESGQVGTGMSMAEVRATVDR